MSGCALKQGSKAHSSLCQSNFITQLQNEAALMSCRIWAVEHRKCAAGLADAHHGLQDRILLNYTRIENAHKVRKKTSDFLLWIEFQQIFSCPFSLLRHYQMPEYFYVNSYCFWARATVLPCYRNWQCSQCHCGQHVRCSAIADKIKTIVSVKANYRGTQS